MCWDYVALFKGCEEVKIWLHSPILQVELKCRLPGDKGLDAYMLLHYWV